MSDAGVTETGEMGDDLGGGASVIDLHRRVLGNARAPVHQHEGEPFAAHRGERRVRHAARRD